MRLRYMPIALLLCLTARAAPAADPGDREFVYAESLSQRNLDELAVMVMDRFVKDYPDHTRYEEALVTRGKYLQKTGDTQGALAAFETFIEKYSYSRFKIEAMCRSAELFYDLGRWPEAAKRLQALLDIKEQLPPDWIMRARYYLAWCTAQTGQYEDAMKRFRDFAVLCPDSALADEAHLAIGDCLRRVQRYENAFAAYGRVMGEAHGEQAIAAAFGMGMACLEAKEYRRGIVAFAEVLRRDAKCRLAPQALLRKADCFLALGDRAGARGSLSQIITELPKDPAFPDALDRLGQLLRSEPKAAGPKLPSLSDIETYSLALAQVRAKDLTGAAATLEPPSKGRANAWVFRAAVTLAAALQDAGKLSDAANWYSKAYATGGDDPLAPDCLLNAADLRLKAGEDAEAARLLAQFLAAHAGHERACLARWNLAQLYLKDRKYADAARMLELVANAPSSSSRSDAVISAGMAWSLAGEYEKAVATFKRLEDQPGLSAFPPEALFAYADALARTGNAEHAAKALRRLIAGAQSPAQAGAQLVWANYLLGVICERTGAWEEAAKAFARADDPAAPTPLRADALLHRVMALFRLGRPEDCASSLAQIMRRYPSKALPLPAYAWLAAESLRTGDMARAAHVGEALADRAGPQTRYRSFALLTQARCAIALGKWEEAAALLQDLSKDGAADAGCEYAARRMLADCLHETGKDSEAEALLHELATQSYGQAAAETEAALAQRLHAMGRPAEAAAVFRHVLVIFGTASTRDLAVASYRGLATCEAEMGHVARARLARQRLTEVTSNQ